MKKYSPNLPTNFTIFLINKALNFVQYTQTPIGLLAIVSSETGLQSISLVNSRTQEENPSPITKETVSQLTEYFNGRRKTFEVSFDLGAYTAFQQKVWQLLQSIPFGTTISYSDLALKYGDIKAIRAVAAANGKNPIPIIIPCHRVIGRNGSLTGFALGLHIKQKLLTLENPNKYRTQGAFGF
ncbi:MAG: methylated-DNA--[protein]-cysteine S-methyltransferase [Saprospiraceae bacterium]|nr:methylated-DNA--[protein]-cysteine S-methyltransferase [Saprospiraceae bacterium]